MQPALFVSSRNPSRDLSGTGGFDVCQSDMREYRIRKMNKTLLKQQKQTSNQYMILTLNYQTIVICNTITHNHFTFYSKARSGAKRKE